MEEGQERQRFQGRLGKASTTRARGHPAWNWDPSSSQRQGWVRPGQNGPRLFQVTCRGCQTWVWRKGLVRIPGSGREKPKPLPRVPNSYTQAATHPLQSDVRSVASLACSQPDFSSLRPALSTFFFISRYGSPILPGAQTQNSGVTPDSSLSHTSYLVHQQILTCF